MLILEIVTSRKPWRQKLELQFPILIECHKCVINNVSNKCMIVTKQLEPTQLNDISFSDSNLAKRGKTSFKQKSLLSLLWIVWQVSVTPWYNVSRTFMNSVWPWPLTSISNLYIYIMELSLARCFCSLT